MHKQYHLQEQPLPPGYRIYEERLSIPGIHHQRANVLAFCRAQGQRLELERDATNSNDQNAIKIVGCWRGWFGQKRKSLGFVPRKVAARLVETDLFSAVQPRLLKTYAGSDGYVEIEFQIVGPSKEFRRYRPLGESPVDRLQAAKESGDTDSTLAVLVGWVEATEAEAKTEGYGVAPRPYLDLAKLYRKLKRFDDEVAILERYDRQPKAPGVLPGQLAERLSKARRLRDKQRGPAQR